MDKDKFGVFSNKIMNLVGGKEDVAVFIHFVDGAIEGFGKIYVYTFTSSLSLFSPTAYISGDIFWLILSLIASFAVSAVMTFVLYKDKAPAASGSNSSVKKGYRSSGIENPHFWQRNSSSRRRRFGILIKDMGRRN